MAGPSTGECINYDYCDVADRKDVVDIAPGGDTKCPECGKELQIGGKITDRLEGIKKRLPLIGMVVGGILLVAAVGWLVWSYTTSARCEVSEVRSMMELDPKLGELEKAGLACLKAGQSKGDSDMLVTAMLALRAASDKGSTAAAAAMGRLFDPLVRADLEKDAKVPQLLPTPDPAIAVGFYDKAAAADAEARNAAARLRGKYPSLAREASNRDGSPLTMPGYEGLYQRALVKPNAMLVDSPGAAGGTALQTFDIVYVFGIKPGWRRVGHSLESGPEGWVAESDLQNWNVMLVMRYAAQGARNPVLYFRDETAAKAVLLEPDPATSVANLIKTVADGKPDPRLAAIEDKSIDWRSTPYMMPILRTAPVTADDGRTIYLAEVGSVAGKGQPVANGLRPATQSPSPTAATVSGRPAYCTDRTLQTSVHQVVFVIDTTSSMGPYIEGVRQIADRWRDEIARRNLGEKFRFGVVAYRNNMDAEPQKSGLEYVTRTALPLSKNGDAATLASVMSQLQPAKVSTHSFDEDPVAGLEEALSFDWSQGCGLREIFLVTDAGALKSDDPKTRHLGTGLSTIAARAHEMNIDILPVHLHTPEARQAGDIDRAANQYRTELDTNNGLNYRPIPNGSPQGFGAYLGEVSVLIDALDKESRGQLTPKPTTAGTVEKPISVKDMMLSKLFSVQQRFLGALAGASAPTFASTWTSDRDLGNINQTALEVSVFLTRRQLNQLAEKTDYLIRSATQAKTESSRFFTLLRMVSAATAQDPKRFSGENANLGALMPSFLGILPYKSDVLALTAEDWRAMGPSKQDAFVRRLREKLVFYRQLDADQSQWRELGSTDSAEAAALVPLKQLP
jgi:serine/threonine-protein kinase PpkA